ncbi:MAG: vitamin K epoxide reductase family protein [Patescibacteria group bacterium]
MTRKNLLYTIGFFAFIGLLDAWYLADMALTGGSLTCTLEGLDGCNVVAQSSYSRLFGQPLALYGVFFYVFFLITASLAFYKPTRTVDHLIILLGIGGFASSLYFLYVQFVLIQALCVYCLGSAIASTCLLALAILLKRRGHSLTIP